MVGSRGLCVLGRLAGAFPEETTIQNSKKPKIISKKATKSLMTQFSPFSGLFSDRQATKGLDRKGRTTRGIAIRKLQGLRVIRSLGLKIPIS